MLIDIGKKKPVESDHVYKVIHSDPPDAERRMFTWDGDSSAVHHIKSISAQEVVDLCGVDDFVRLDYPDRYTGEPHKVYWIRRSMMREVVPMPEPIAREYGECVLLQMVFDEPLPQPWPPKRRFQPAYTMCFDDMSVDEVRALLGL